MDLTRDKGEALAKELGDSFEFFQGSVASYDDMARVFSQTFDKWKRIDAFCSNAGIGDQSSVYILQHRGKTESVICPRRCSFANGPSHASHCSNKDVLLGFHLRRIPFAPMSVSRRFSMALNSPFILCDRMPPRAGILSLHRAWLEFTRWHHFQSTGRPRLRYVEYLISKFYASWRCHQTPY